MITLYIFAPMWGLPDASPFVMKTEVQLKLSGLDYTVEHGGLGQSPKGKLPFISDDGEIISDSVFIRDHLERKYALDLDFGLTAAQRAQSWATERMLEDHLYWATVYARWGNETNFNKGPAQFFAGAPAEVSVGAHQHMIDTLHAQGFGRHTPQQVGMLAYRSFAALSNLLGDQDYLFGNTATALDAGALATVAGATVEMFDSPVTTAAMSFPNLITYRNRLMARFYPELVAA